MLNIRIRNIFIILLASFLLLSVDVFAVDMLKRYTHLKTEDLAKKLD